MNTTETMDFLEVKRHEKLQAMLAWRLRPGANGLQHAEAEALSWALDIIADYFELEDN